MMSFETCSGNGTPNSAQGDEEQRLAAYLLRFFSLSLKIGAMVVKNARLVELKPQSAYLYNGLFRTVGALLAPT